MKLKYVGYNGCVYDSVIISLPTGGELVAEAHKPFSIDNESGRGLLASGAYEEVVPEPKRGKEEPKAEVEPEPEKEEVAA